MLFLVIFLQTFCWQLGDVEKWSLLWWLCFCCCCWADFMGRMRSELHRNLPISAAYRYKQPSCTDGSSTVSVNRFASEEMLLGDGEISFRHNITQWEDIVCVATSSAGSSLSLGDWHPATGRINDQTIMGGEPCPSLRLELNRDHPFMWEEKREKRQTELSGRNFQGFWFMGAE